MKKLYFVTLFGFIMPFFGLGLQAQNKTIKIRQEETLTGAHEFILTLEGGDYNTLLHQAEEILDNESMVMRHVFFPKLQRISAIVKDPWTFDNLKALFEAQGFIVVNKADAWNGSADHN